MAALLLLASSDVGELRPESLLQLLHLLDALHRGGDPGLEYRLGAHGVEARPQAVLDLAHDALLHRPEIGQAEEGARLLGRAGHFNVYFHALLSVCARAHHVRLESAGRDVPFETGAPNSAFPIGWNRKRFPPIGSRFSLGGIAP